MSTLRQKQEPEMQSIILIDDEDFFRNRLVKAFTKRGYRAFGAANFDEAITIIEEKKPQLAVVDLKMPGKSGLELIMAAKLIVPAIKMIVLTGYGSIATAIDAVKLGALSYMSKPADVEEIIKAFSSDINNIESEVNNEPLMAPSLARAEWEHINRVLADCEGNISKTAQKLGIHRRSLQRKLLKYPPKT